MATHGKSAAKTAVCRTVFAADKKETILLLEALEIAPVVVGFGSRLQRCREVGEEVEAGPGLNLVHADGTCGVIVAVVVFVIEPEPDGLGVGDSVS